jgi:hypothetical protein
MKTPKIFVGIMLGLGALSAEDIPTRSPEIGESRPSWWLSCWMDHIVVVEGTISVVEDNKPDVTVVVDPETAKTFFDEESIKLQKSFSSFYLAKMKPKRILFASPAITLADLRIERIESGDMEDLTFLVPLLQSNGRYMTMMGGRDKQEGIFILRYGSMMSSVPFVFDEAIPEDGIASAEKVFEHRSRLDHRKHKYEEAEQAGTGQPATRPELKSEGSDKPQPEAEGRSR